MKQDYFRLDTLTPKRIKRPEWLKIRLNINSKFQNTHRLIEKQNV